MPEVMDYGPYLDGDTWPSESRQESFWVGDMVPQHAASAIAKLIRWSKEQPALDLARELENEHTVRASRLYAHLAARATSSDFVFDGVTENGVIAAVHDAVPYDVQLAVLATGIAHQTTLEPGDLVRTVVALHQEIDGLGYALIKKEI